MVEPSETSEKTAIRCAGHVLQRGIKAGQECNGLLLTSDGYVLCNNEKHPEHILSLLRRAIDSEIISEAELYNELNITITQGGNVETATAPKNDPNTELLEIAFGLAGTQKERDALELAVLLNRTLLTMRSIQTTIPNPYELEGREFRSNFMYVRFEFYRQERNLHVVVGLAGSTAFMVNHDYSIEKLVGELERFLVGTVEEYHKRVNFYRMAIVAMPHLAQQKKTID